MKKNFLSLFIILSVFLISCSTAKNIVLKSNQNQDSVVLSSKDSLTIELVSNPSTGYKWIFETNTKKLPLVNETFIQPSSNLIGVAGKQVFIFNAKKKGHVSLKFYYSRINSDTIKNKELSVFIK